MFWSFSYFCKIKLLCFPSVSRVYLDIQHSLIFFPVSVSSILKKYRHVKDMTQFRCRHNFWTFQLSNYKIVFSMKIKLLEKNENLSSLSCCKDFSDDILSSVKVVFFCTINYANWTLKGATFVCRKWNRLFIRQYPISIDYWNPLLNGINALI